MAPVRFYYSLDRRVTTRVHARSHPIDDERVQRTNGPTERTERTDRNRNNQTPTSDDDDDNDRVITIARTHNTHLE